MDDRTRRLASDILLRNLDPLDETSQDDETPNSPSKSYNSNILLRRRLALSRAITLLETKCHHSLKQKQADLLLSYLMQNMSTSMDTSHVEHRGGGFDDNNFRIGLAGPPGAGKSSFIEAIGMYILDELPMKQNESWEGKDNSPWSNYCPSQVGVVCVDPSSSVSGGSILGDKTRMTQLSRHERAYIRPSANAGVVGGLAAYTDDVVSCCQAAGYSLVLLETVGLGQSEIEVAQSVDMVLLLLPPGGGDDLQGVKKGIVEISDMMVVTKADGTLLPAAKQTAADYRGALRLLQDIGNSSGSSNKSSSLPTWKPPVLLTSSATGEGLDKVWEQICAYRQYVMQTGTLQKRRQEQATYWMWKHLSQLVQNYIRQQDPAITEQARQLEESLEQRQLTPRVAAAQLLHQVLLRTNSKDMK